MVPPTEQGARATYSAAAHSSVLPHRLWKKRWHRMRTINGMSAASSLPVAAVPSIRRVQLITVVWMSVEVLVSVIAALRAHSVALLAFGGDCLLRLVLALGGVFPVSWPRGIARQ